MEHGSIVIQTNEIEQNPRDIVALAMELYRKDSKWRLLIFWLGLAILEIILFMSRNQSPVTTILAVLTTFLVGIPLHFWWIKKQLYRSANSFENSQMYGPMRYVISNAMIEVKRNDGTSSTFRWAPIIKVMIWSGRYVLFISESSIMMLHPDNFQSAQDFAMFASLADSRKETLLTLGHK